MMYDKIHTQGTYAHKNIAFHTNRIRGILEDFLLEVLACQPTRSTAYLTRQYVERHGIVLRSVTQNGRFKERYYYILNKELACVPDGPMRNQVIRVLHQNRQVGYTALLLRADQYLTSALQWALGSEYEEIIKSGLPPEKKDDFLRKISSAFAYKIYE